MATNRLTNHDFASGSASWTTDSPLVDATRTYTFSGGTFQSDGTGLGSISQLITVTPGETLFISFRGFQSPTAAGSALVRWGIYIPASATWRHVSDLDHTYPRSQYFGNVPTYHCGEVTIPAGVTSVRVAVVLNEGITRLTDISCYTSPNLVKDGDLSTNTTGAVGGDGGTPEGWTLDWDQLTGSPGLWTTDGGALMHSSGASTSGCAGASFAVTAGEYLYASAVGFSTTRSVARVKVVFSTTTNFTKAQQLDEVSVTTAALFEASTRPTKFARFVQVPAGMTYARIVVYCIAAATQCWYSRTTVRRLSALSRPSIRVDLSVGAAGNEAWVVGADSTSNEVGSSFLSPWPSTFSTPWNAPFIDVSSVVRSGLTINRGRNSRTADFETGSLSFELDDPDRDFDPLNASGPYYGFLGVGYPLRVSFVDGDTDEPFALFSGRVTSWKPTFNPNVVHVVAAEYYTDLNATMPDRAFSSELTSELVDDALDDLGWDSDWRRTDIGTVTVPAISHTSGSYLPLMRAAANTQRAVYGGTSIGFGAFYLDGEGRPVFRVTALPRQAESMATFGDPADLANPYRLDFEAAAIEYDSDLTRNYAKATRVGGASSDLQSSADTTSVQAIGQLEYSAPSPGLLFATNAEVLAWCETFIGVFSQRGPRIASMDIWPEPNVAWWGLLMWAEFGDRFTVIVEPPPEGSDPVTQDVQMEAFSLTGNSLAQGGIRARWVFVPATT